MQIPNLPNVRLFFVISISLLSPVVVISSSRDKEHDAKAFGAHEFVCTQDPIATSTKMDYILNTVAGDLPWETFINLLDTNGTLINMGVSAKGSMEIPYFPHLFKQRRSLFDGS